MTSPPAAPPKRPKLKLHTGSRQPSFSQPPTASATATPSGETASKILKLKVPVSAKSQPATPAPIPVVKSKAGRAVKPTARLLESRKRGNADLDDSDDDLAASASQPQKKLKILNTSATGVRPKINIKGRGDFPVRSHGEGYDSCASDNEDSLEIHEQIILRMPPGPECNYVHEGLKARKIPGDSGFDFSLKFLDDTRHALVRVKGQLYAAILVDLPTVTETMKTWDRKAFVKSADICQMLLVHTPVTTEAEALSAPLPSTVREGQKWPHGLTPPMHDCINRRFKKIPSKKEVLSKEEQVDNLLEEDDKWDESHVYVVKPEADENRNGDVDADADADGEADDGYFDDQMAAEGDADADMDDLEDMLLLDMQKDGGAEDGVGEHDAQGTIVGDELEQSGEEEEDYDDDDDDAASGTGGQDDAVKEEIAEIEREIKDKEGQLATQTNQIFIQRFKSAIKNLKADLELKKASIGLQDAD